MIENNSKYNKKDIAFTIKMWIWKNPLVIIYRSLWAILGFWFILCGMNNLLSVGTGIELVIFGLFAFYMSIFSLSNIYKTKVKKNSMLNLPRNTKITDDEIEINVADNEKNISNTYKFSNINKYYIRKDAVVIELKDKKGNIFIHNDGYVKGNKEELINVLNKSNIKKGKHNKSLNRLLTVVVTLLIIVGTIFIEDYIERKNIKINTGIVYIDGVNVELGKPIEYYESTLGIKLSRGNYTNDNYNKYVITNIGSLDENLAKCLSFHGDSEYIYGIETYVNGKTSCYNVVFPQRVSMLDDTSLIRKKYSTGLLNFYVRGSIEYKTNMKKELHEDISFIGNEYRLEVTAIDRNVTSIYYYYTGESKEKVIKKDGGNWSSMEGGNIARKLYEEYGFDYEEAINMGRNISRSNNLNKDELLQDIFEMKNNGRIVYAKENPDNLTVPSTYYGDGYSIFVYLGGECTEYTIYNDANEEIGNIIKVIPLTAKE